MVGVDHSAVVIGQARRRNANAIKAGRVRLIHAPVEHLQVADGPFDAALAVNTVGMWPEPTVRLREIGRLLRAGGRIALVSQPRYPSATAAVSPFLLSARFAGRRRSGVSLPVPERKQASH